MPTKSLDWGAALQSGWDGTKKHLGLVLLLCAGSIALLVVEQGLCWTGRHLGFFGFPLFGIGIVLAIVLKLVWVRAVLRLHDGRPVDLGELFADGGRLLNFAGAFLLLWILTMLGFLFFFVPGVIVLLYYGMTPFVVLDERLGPVEALRRSADLTQGARYDLFVLALAALGVNLLGFLALGIGLFVTIPMTWLAYAACYRRLQEQTPAPTPSYLGPTGDAAV
jgi:hypothetical protein